MTVASSWRFVIIAAACPQLPLRLLGLFAQRDLIPRDVAIRCAGDTLDIVVIQDALDPHHAEVIAAKMRALVMVRHVSQCPEHGDERPLAVQKAACSAALVGRLADQAIQPGCDVARDFVERSVAREAYPEHPIGQR